MTPHRMVSAYCAVPIIRSSVPPMATVAVMFIRICIKPPWKKAAVTIR